MREIGEKPAPSFSARWQARPAFFRFFLLAAEKRRTPRRRTARAKATAVAMFAGANAGFVAEMNGFWPQQQRAGHAHPQLQHQGHPHFPQEDTRMAEKLVSELQVRLRLRH